MLVNFIENIQTVHGIFALGKHLFFLFAQLNTAFPKRGCIVTSGMIITRDTNGLLQKFELMSVFQLCVWRPQALKGGEMQTKESSA